MIEVLDTKLRVVAICPTPEAATAAARLLGGVWLRDHSAAWSASVRLEPTCRECDRLRDELEAVARVRP